MKKIFKYTLEIKDQQTIHVQKHADRKFIEQVLYVDVQNGIPCIWALVDDEDDERAIRIIIHGTGQDASDTYGLKHIGSFMLLDGAFVGHVFAEVKP